MVNCSEYQKMFSDIFYNINFGGGRSFGIFIIRFMYMSHSRKLHAIALQSHANCTSIARKCTSIARKWHAKRDTPMARQNHASH